MFQGFAGLVRFTDMIVLYRLLRFPPALQPTYPSFYFLSHTAYLITARALTIDSRCTLFLTAILRFQRVSNHHTGG